MMAVYLLKPALKACSVAKNISQENKVCNKILSVVARRLEFDNGNCFCDAVDFYRELFTLLHIVYPRIFMNFSVQKTWPKEYSYQ